MNSILFNICALFIGYLAIITTVYCVDLHGNVVTEEELISLTRDHYGRKDPDALLNGFFPVWAVIQFLLACFFFVLAVLSFGCYLLGCKTPPEEQLIRNAK